jgi:hypothetical protein
VRRKIVSGVLVASLLFSVGCSSSYVVSSSPNPGPSFDAFNAEMQDKTGTIVFQDGGKWEGKNILVSSDSTRFLIETTDAPMVVPTRTIKKVVFTNRGTGFLEGFGLGALAGSVVVLALPVASSGGEFSDWSYVLFFTLLGAGAGGVVGGIPGLIMGHSYAYEFASSADSTAAK